MTVPARLYELVERFARERAAYRSGECNEAQVRVEYQPAVRGVARLGLIGGYQYPLDWHRDRYVEDGPEKHRKELYKGRGDEWHLTIDERKRIPKNNIYGVDIDPQAVESPSSRCS